MRIPLGIFAVPILIIGVFGTLVSPETVIRYIESWSVKSPWTISWESAVPWIVGNRSVGEIAITCFTVLVVKQCIDYFEKS